MIGEIEKVGAKNVLVLCTDGVYAMAKARKEIVAMAPYKHIFNIRCMMHAFALLMGSVLGHIIPKAIVTQAQKIVTFFRASHKPHALLGKTARDMKVKGSLITSNKTRFTSVHLCLDSIAVLEAPLKAVCDNHTEYVSVPVCEIIKDRRFWSKLHGLCEILEPMSKTIMAVQENRVTLADITKLWIFLGNSLSDVVSNSELSMDFLEHVVGSYKKRVAEFDTSLCRLGLFLDPRFKGVLCSKERVDEVMKLVSKYIHTYAYIYIYMHGYITLFERIFPVSCMLLNICKCCLYAVNVHILRLIHCFFLDSLHGGL
jgi:hypothetical protein